MHSEYKDVYNFIGFIEVHTYIHRLFQFKSNTFSGYYKNLHIQYSLFRKFLQNLHMLSKNVHISRIYTFSVEKKEYNMINTTMLILTFLRPQKYMVTS